MARISYRRPETWTFLFTAKLLAVNNANLGSVNVNFNLTVGVGLSSVTIPGFWNFPFSWIAGAAPIGLQGFTSSTLGSALQTVPSLVPSIISEIPAQDLQCNVSITYVGGAPTDSASVEFSAFFSPKTHIRPDWFMRDFEGEELHGK